MRHRNLASAILLLLGLAEGIQAAPSVKAIAAGGDRSLALTSDGTVWEWGAKQSTPVRVTGLTGVVRIAAGDQHSLAVKGDGTVWAWGQNTSGQLGDGTTTNRATPVQVSGLTGVAAVAGGAARHETASVPMSFLAACRVPTAG